uniref:NcSP26 protein n=1 Tax=Nephotettix cincticeps TaxID=94400 RepID=A0A0E4FH30_NEPCI|nr:NcSP26 [Nephotettix cincticeps]
MNSFVVIVLAACCAHTLAFSQCNTETLNKIKASYKGTPLGKKLASAANKDGVLVAVTPFYFPVGVKCATTLIGKDVPSGQNYKTITTYDTFGKKTVGSKDEVKKDDVGFYTEGSEGIKTYIVPFYEKNGIVGVVTCTDKKSENKAEYLGTDGFIKFTYTTKPADLAKALADVKEAIAEAKEAAEKLGITTWDPAFGSPEECAKVIS